MYERHSFNAAVNFKPMFSKVDQSMFSVVDDDHRNTRKKPPIHLFTSAYPGDNISKLSKVIDNQNIVFMKSTLFSAYCICLPGQREPSDVSSIWSFNPTQETKDNRWCMWDKFVILGCINKSDIVETFLSSAMFSSSSWKSPEAKMRCIISLVCPGISHQFPKHFFQLAAFVWMELLTFWGPSCYPISEGEPNHAGQFLLCFLDINLQPPSPLKVSR